MVEKRTCPVCKTNADACGYSAFGNFKGYYHWGCLAVALSDLVTELESQLARQAPVIEAARDFAKVCREWPMDTTEKIRALEVILVAIRKLDGR